MAQHLVLLEVEAAQAAKQEKVTTQDAVRVFEGLMRGRVRRTFEHAQRGQLYDRERASSIVRFQELERALRSDLAEVAGEEHAKRWDLYNSNIW